VSKFITSLLVGFGALAVSGGAAFAGPIDYSINFTPVSPVCIPSSGIPCGTPSPGNLLPSSGVFTYDSDTQTFSGFTVVWDNISYDFTAIANNTVAPACSLKGAAYVFSYLTLDSSDLEADDCDFEYEWDAGNTGVNGEGQFIFSDNAAGSSRLEITNTPGTPDVAPGDLLSGVGTWTTAQSSSTPEPGSLILTFTGFLVLAGICAARRTGRPLASGA
jgi:hypothetical protein